MRDLIELVKDYSSAEVIIILILAILALKGAVELWEWFSSRIRKWYDKLRGQEKKEETIDDRITSLEKHDIKQEQSIEAMSNTLNAVAKGLMDLQIETMKSRILDFGNIAVDYDRHPSKEKYNSIFSTYAKYEEILKSHDMENGETEVTMDAIRNSYRVRMENHGFLEDMNIK